MAMRSSRRAPWHNEGVRIRDGGGMRTRAMWLVKALAESGHEQEELLLDASEADAQRHPLPGEWSLVEIAGHLRDRESITAYHMEQLLLETATSLRLHDLEWLDPAPEYGDAGLGHLLRAYAAQRRWVCHMLVAVASCDRDPSAHHPFMGTVSVLRLADALHDHDLEHLWQARRLRAALAVSPARAAGADAGAPPHRSA